MRVFCCLLAASLLLTYQASAQQPVLPGAPQPNQLPPAPTAPLPARPLAAPLTGALPTAEVIGHSEVIGQAYSVETMAGTQFIGTLRAATDQTLTFENSELGIITVQRLSVRQLIAQTPEQARHGFDYVGNGTRMFFAPTARNLLKGEGTVQVINIFLLSANYGISDNFSVGLLAPVIPSYGVPFVAVTPKLSVLVSDRLHVGVGVLYGFATGSGISGSAGVGYGVVTYGSADTNITLGLGYGLGSNGFGNTPVGVLGANVRLSRLFSLVNETYIANLDGNGGLAGLAGLRYASPRFSASLGALYVTVRNGGVYPAYLEAAYRFGRIRLK